MKRAWRCKQHLVPVISRYVKSLRTDPLVKQSQQVETASVARRLAVTCVCFSIFDLTPSISLRLTNFLNDSLLLLNLQRHGGQVQKDLQ